MYCLALAVGVQAKKHSFDANPAAKKSLPHGRDGGRTGPVLERVRPRREKVGNRAEGNGYSSLGSRLPDFGIVFTFERTGWPRFYETRIIPTSIVKELCFGNAPTFYRAKDCVADEAWERVLRKAEDAADADTLNLIGCNAATTLYFLRDRKTNH